MEFHDGQAWIDALTAAPDPGEPLDRMIMFRDRIAGAGTEEPEDTLVGLLRPRLEDAGLATTVDRALRRWFEHHLADSVETVQTEGWNLYVQAWEQALGMALRLRPRETARFLADKFDGLDDWTHTLSANGFDLRRRYYEALAHVQPDRRFLSLWYDLCDRAGLERNQTWLDTGLTGLRFLPRHGDAAPVNPEVFEGVARWARHLSDTEADRAWFDDQWPMIQALNGLDDDAAAGQARPLLARHGHKPFARWWAEALGLDAPDPANAPDARTEPSQGETDQKLKEIRNATEDAIPGIVDGFIRRHEAYADANLDRTHLPRALNRAGHTVLDRAPAQAVRLARTALAWEWDNAHNWLLLSRGLHRAGRTAEAERVLWKACRVGPDWVRCRNELAKVLRLRRRPAEAEALYRETTRRFDDDAASRNALAHLLRTQGHDEAAEQVYRATVRGFRDNAVSRTALARLLRDQERFEEAETLYNEVRGMDRNNPVCRVDLGLMLLDLGRPVETVEALRDEIPAHEHAGIRILNAHIEAVKAGRTRPRRDRDETEAPEPEPLAGDARWQGLAEEADAAWADFLLSDAFGESAGLVLSTPEERRRLRDEARAKLEQLHATNPHHPVVRLVAWRHGLRREPDILEAPAHDDFPTRLAVAIANRGGDGPERLESLWRDFTDTDHRAMTAVALLVVDARATEQVVEALQAFQHTDNERRRADPAFTHLRRHLGRHLPLPEWPPGVVAQLLTQKLQSLHAPLRDILDIVLLALVERHAPDSSLEDAVETAEAA